MDRLDIGQVQVLPATGSKVSLIAHHPDGSKSTGEVEISRSSQPIQRVEMRPLGGRGGAGGRHGAAGGHPQLPAGAL